MSDNPYALPKSSTKTSRLKRARRNPWLLGGMTLCFLKLTHSLIYRILDFFGPIWDAREWETVLCLPASVFMTGLFAYLTYVEIHGRLVRGTASG